MIHAVFIGWHWDVRLTCSSYTFHVQDIQSESFIFPFFNKTYLSRGRKTLDEMLAWNLDAHVMGGCHNYDSGVMVVLN